MKQDAIPSVKSANRALDVLEYVARSAESPTFAQIGTALAIPGSSLFYMLGTLTTRGYLKQQTPKSGYQLGPALASLAAAATEQASWTRLARPLVDKVWNRLKETTSYFEPRGDEMECMIVKLAQHSLIPIHRVGERSPLYVFSGGKLVLANHDDDRLNAYLKRTKLVRFTPHTITTATALRREIAEVRRAGIGISREEHSLGTLGISVGLYAAQGLVGTLGVAIPAARFDERIESEIRSELRKAAQEFMTIAAREIE